MVIKQAAPPIKFEIGSARKTPFAFRPKQCGKIRISGTTITALRKMEKKIACFDFPSAVKTD